MIIVNEKRLDEYQKHQDSLHKMPINMAMHNPPTRNISPESDRDIFTSASQVDDVPPDRVHKVGFSLSNRTDNTERVSVQVHGVLESIPENVRNSAEHSGKLALGLTGPPGEPPGILISMTLSRGSV